MQCLFSKMQCQRHEVSFDRTECTFVQAKFSKNGNKGGIRRSRNFASNTISMTKTFGPKSPECKADPKRAGGTNAKPDFRLLKFLRVSLRHACVTTSLVPLHITSYTECLPTTCMGTSERFLPRMRVTMYS